MSEHNEVTSLKARVSELEAQLAPYLEAEARALRLAEAKDRAEQIINFLFPQFNSVAARSDPSLRPPQWHENSWWWNGASIKWHRSSFDECGGQLTIRSYVGGGEVEEIELIIPKGWIDATADEWLGIVTEFRDQKVKKRADSKVAQQAAEAQRQIDAAQRTLRRLGVPT